ncbi:MAG TPA: hypothetical protein VMF69_08125 [Gemmataceae bacterium]|nr:hypothetical protein [Gemmataceae bacterium]
MRKISGSGLILAMVVFAVCAAPAPEARLIGIVNLALPLLSNVQVQEELKLSEDQLKKIEELKAELKTKRSQELAALRSLNLEERTKKMQDIIKSNEAAYAKILSRQQLRRAEQIYLQLRGPTSLIVPQVRAALKITNEQEEKMTAIMRESSREYRNSRENRGQKTLTEINKRRDEEILNVLTPAQKAKWKQLLGELFNREPRRTEEKKQSGQGSERPALAK